MNDNNTKSIKVLKFGGSSVKSLARIQHVAEIIYRISQEHKVLVVVSAMGDTTDYLVKIAKQASPFPQKREYDLLLSTGEQISVSLVSMILNDLGLKCRSLTGSQLGIYTENIHTKARIIDIDKQNILKFFAYHQILVVAGFQGVTADGDITTLGRGGSDTTAVALAAAIEAGECDIYTDVDGIFTSDPNKIKSARLLKEISYGEVLEMARLGAQVLHPRAVELAKQYNIELRVRNTFKPEHTGTLIKEGAEMELFKSISGVAVDEDQATVTITEIPDKPGIAGKITQALSDHNISVDMIMQSFFHPDSGFNNITFTVHDSDLAETIKVLKKIQSELSAKDVLADPDSAKVSLIGAGLCGQSWIPAKLFSTLGENNINIKMISTSEMKITCVVKRSEVHKAANLIHTSFGLEVE